MAPHLRFLFVRTGLIVTPISLLFRFLSGLLLRFRASPMRSLQKLLPKSDELERIFSWDFRFRLFFLFQWLPVSLLKLSEFNVLLIFVWLWVNSHQPILSILSYFCEVFIVAETFIQWLKSYFAIRIGNSHRAAKG